MYLAPLSNMIRPYMLRQSSLEYSAGSTPLSAQPPTPSASAMNDSVTVAASSPPFSRLAACGVSVMPTSNLLKSAGVEEKLARDSVKPNRFFVDLKIFPSANFCTVLVLNWKLRLLSRYLKMLEMLISTGLNCLFWCGNYNLIQTQHNKI